MAVVKKVAAFVALLIVSVYLILTVTVFAGRYLNDDHLLSGTVMGIRYDSGKPYETVIRFWGNEIRHTHNPEPGYLMTVRNGNKMDVWRVSRDTALKYSIGDTVKK